MASGACARVKSHCLPHTLKGEARMKIKQTVEAKYSHVYIGWSGVQFTDPVGNEIKIEISDDQLLELAEVIRAKRDSILEERAAKVDEVE
jgi:hypothetical protein